jgi:hypothetical protein
MRTPSGVAFEHYIVRLEKTRKDETFLIPIYYSARLHERPLVRFSFILES